VSLLNGEITNQLPGERSLQQEFGLAPVAIRKTARKLAAERIVRATPGMGSFVVKTLASAGLRSGPWLVARVPTSPCAARTHPRTGQDVSKEEST